LDEAIAIVVQQSDGNGLWPLNVRHRNTLYEDLAGPVGEPNRWITMRALRVLHRYAHPAALSRARDDTVIPPPIVRVLHRCRVILNARRSHRFRTG
jgi:hypothetical protein